MAAWRWYELQGSLGSSAAPDTWPSAGKSRLFHANEPIKSLKSSKLALDNWALAPTLATRKEVC